MIIRSADLVKTVFVARELIQDNVPQIVFLGRSNVGKSSLINRLVNRKKLARTSSTPGKTLSVNYYRINDHFYLVDLPGYGYARVPKHESSRVKGLMDAFFKNNPRIRLVVHLIDSRRGYLDNDVEILEKILEGNFRLLTVLTKSDKLNSSALKSQIQSLIDRFGVRALPFSIKSESCRIDLANIIKAALKE